MAVSEKIRNLKFVYENGPDNIGRDFVKPCLEECVLYRRGSGFFSSSALLAYVDALESIIDGRTKVQIICSPVVKDQQVLEILEGNLTKEQRDQTINRLCDDIFEIAVGFRLDPERREYRHQLLAYFIASGSLELRFAIPVDFTSIPLEQQDEKHSKNLYHVKKGYFVFEDGSIVGFSGSFNESDSGHQHHIEDTQVWKSWVEADAARLEHVKKTVDADWAGENRYLKTFKMSERALEIAKKLSPISRPRKSAKPDAIPSDKLSVNNDLLRDYQERALGAWKLNQYRGILSMATGTGKTKTAIAALKRFRSKALNGLIFVTVPTRALAAQWKQEIVEMGIDVVSVFDSQDNWINALNNYLHLHLNGQVVTEKTPVFICVNKSFESIEFQSLVSRLNVAAGNRLLIVDECHHFNKKARLKKLPTGFNYRLGLSATPFESDEPRVLEHYFGGIVFEFSLGDAIKQGYLVPYRYHPVLIEMTDNEADEYIRISKKLVSTINNDDVTSDENQNTSDMLDSVLEGMIAKFLKLEEILKNQKPTPHTLFYSGGGSMTLGENEKVRRLDSLGRLLGELGWKLLKITYHENENDRKIIVEQFKRGIVDAILSIRILDEGIDIPDCRTAYILASQRSERQGIQRRGRILRKCAGKDSADLYDFIVVGPMSDERILRDLYTKELRRARMFAQDALNQEECLASIGQF